MKVSIRSTLAALQTPPANWKRASRAGVVPQMPAPVPEGNRVANIRVALSDVSSPLKLNL